MGRFKEVSSQMGALVSGEHFFKGPGRAAVGDYNKRRLVWMALVLNMNDLPSFYFATTEGNKAETGSRSRLMGTKCNRTAIGPARPVAGIYRKSISQNGRGGTAARQGVIVAGGVFAGLHFRIGKRLENRGCQSRSTWADYPKD